MRTPGLRRGINTMIALAIIAGSALSPKVVHVMEITENKLLINYFVFIAALVFGHLYNRKKAIFMTTGVGLFCLFPAAYIGSAIFNMIVFEGDALSLMTSLRYALTMFVALTIVNMIASEMIALEDFILCCWIVVIGNTAIMLMYIASTLGLAHLAVIDSLYKGEVMMHYMHFGPFAFEFPMVSGIFTETTEFALYIFMLFAVQQALWKSGFLKKPGPLGRWFLQGLVIFLYSKGVLAGYILNVYNSVTRRLTPASKILVKLALFPPMLFLIYQFFAFEATEIMTLGVTQKISGSIGDRLYLIRYMFEFYAQNPSRIFWGFGPRNMGLYLSIDKADALRDINPMSIFSIMADTGVIGFAAFIAINVYVYRKLKNADIRTAALSIFVANMGISLYISYQYYIAIFVLLYADHVISRQADLAAAEQVRPVRA